MSNIVLVGDVGGTNVRFGLAELIDSKVVVHDFIKMPGDDYASFDDALASYLTGKSLDAVALSAVFSLAGPPIGGTVALTNRDWVVSESGLTSKFGFQSVKLANDFKAMARSVPEIDGSGLKVIQAGQSKSDAPYIVAGPGTGFGVATLIPKGPGRWQVLSGEGGYMAYAPQTPIEIELVKVMRRNQGYVSVEHVCAGIGLVPVHIAMSEIYDRPYVETAPRDMLEAAAAGDEMFAEICHIRACGTMTALGDLVLANGALAGAVLAGGVSERLASYLTDEDALNRFYERGRNSRFIENCPIWLLTEATAPLIGAGAIHLKDRSE